MEGVHSIEREPWRVSLHGGHSRDFSDHGRSPLREILETAASRGFHTYGVAEHAPRFEARYLYAEEIALGWDVAKIQRDFETYARTIRALAAEFADRMTVLCGFEAEVVPSDRYADLMLDLRRRFRFDYMVGSVHWIDDAIFDYGKEAYDRVVALQGGLERFAIRYYEVVAEMVRAIRPDVVGHIDVIRKHAQPQEAVATAPIRRAAARALEALREHDCILDVNTAALRRGLGAPYPAPWLLRAAVRDFGLGVCLGDDSHCAADVGAGIEEAREYLLRNGVHTLTTLARGSAGFVRKVVPLE
jgi:histidinol-phosphatase (PHP family)